MAAGVNELPDDIIGSLEDYYLSMNAVEETFGPLLTFSSEEIQEKVWRRTKAMF